MTWPWRRQWAPPQLTIGRIYADGELQSLLRLAPVVDAFTIENPVLRITHLGDGRYDVDDIIAKVTAPKNDPGPQRPRAPGAVQPGAHGRQHRLHRQHHQRDPRGARADAEVPFISTCPRSAR